MQEITETKMDDGLGANWMNGGVLVVSKGVGRYCLRNE